MTTVTYTVPNISCMHCVHTIKTEVAALAGVKQVEADLATKRVTVSFDQPADGQKIRALLAEISYPPAEA